MNNRAPRASWAVVRDVSSHNVFTLVRVGLTPTSMVEIVSNGVSELAFLHHTTRAAAHLHHAISRSTLLLISKITNVKRVPHRDQQVSSISPEEE